MRNGSLALGGWAKRVPWLGETGPSRRRHGVNGQIGSLNELKSLETSKDPIGTNSHLRTRSAQKCREGPDPHEQ